MKPYERPGRYTKTAVNVPQVVIDTNVWVAGFRSRRGSSFAVVSLLGTGAFDLHLSAPLALGHEEVFLRQHEAMGLSDYQAVELVNLICEKAVQHEVHYLWRGHAHDPEDAHVLELAVAASASHLITYNKRDLRPAETFVIQVVTAHEFLQQLTRRK